MFNTYRTKAAITSRNPALHANAIKRPKSPETNGFRGSLPSFKTLWNPTWSHFWQHTLHHNLPCIVVGQEVFFIIQSGETGIQQHLLKSDLNQGHIGHHSLKDCMHWSRNQIKVKDYTYAALKTMPQAITDECCWWVDLPRGRGTYHSIPKLPTAQQSIFKYPAIPQPTKLSQTLMNPLWSRAHPKLVPEVTELKPQVECPVSQPEAPDRPWDTQEKCLLFLPNLSIRMPVTECNPDREVL